MEGQDIDQEESCAAAAELMLSTNTGGHSPGALVACGSPAQRLGGVSTDITTAQH